MQSADSQISMLTELARRSRPDESGCIQLRRDDLVASLERIREDHKREMQALPDIAGRMLGVFGVTA